MIESQYILNILDLLLDGDDVGLALRRQIPYLVDVEYDYTGPGLFVTFAYAEGIEPYRYEKDELLLDGVFISSRN